jgi:hypothetical protein
MEAYMKNVILYSLLSLVAVSEFGYSQEASEPTCIDLAKETSTTKTARNKIATNVTVGAIGGSVAGPVGSAVGIAAAAAASIVQEKNGIELKEVLSQVGSTKTTTENPHGLIADSTELKSLKRKLLEYAEHKSTSKLKKKAIDERLQVINAVTDTKNIQQALIELNKAPIHGVLYNQAEINNKTAAVGKGKNFKDSAKKSKIVLAASWPQLFSRAKKDENVLCRYGMGGVIFTGSKRVVKAIYKQIIKE